MVWQVDCGNTVCLQPSWANNIVELVDSFCDADGMMICPPCEKPRGYIRRSFKLQEEGETWEPMLRGVVGLDGVGDTYQPFVFLASYENQEGSKPPQSIIELPITDLWFSHYKAFGATFATMAHQESSKWTTARERPRFGSGHRPEGDCHRRGAANQAQSGRGVVAPSFLNRGEVLRCEGGVRRAPNPTVYIVSNSLAAYTKNKSLFASFSSEKEDACSFLEEKSFLTKPSPADRANHAAPSCH